MLLKEIYESAQYVTDEEMSSSQTVGAANAALAEVNTKVGTKLPFYTNDNYQTVAYDKFSDSWQMRLIEPYLSYSIAANDSDVNARDFHYNRFLAALKEFQISGIDSIKTDDVDAEGNPIDYKGTSGRVVKINASARSNPFRGWWV
jgi:hypothetical protein